jgi:cytochrome c2
MDSNYSWGRAKCATCHVVKGNPRALGVAGPNLTNVGSRMSIAAWLAEPPRRRRW